MQKKKGKRKKKKEDRELDRICETVFESDGTERVCRSTPRICVLGGWGANGKSVSSVIGVLGFWVIDSWLGDCRVCDLWFANPTCSFFFFFLVHHHPSFFSSSSSFHLLQIFLFIPISLRECEKNNKKRRSKCRLRNPNHSPFTPNSQQAPSQASQNCSAFTLSMSLKLECNFREKRL